MRKTTLVVFAAFMALALTGCLRQSAQYEITNAGTVDARFYVAIHDDYLDESETYKGTPAGEILDHFVTATISPQDFPEWTGFVILLEDEPMSSFNDPATTTWDVRILGDDSERKVYGMEYNSEQDGIRQTIIDNDGYLTLEMTFPGDVVVENGAGVWFGPGWSTVQWNMATILAQPYARARMPFVGLPEPADPPEPNPVVTVVITPDPEPDPVVTPEPDPTESLLPTPSASAVPATEIPAEPADGDSLPVWIWIVGAALVATLAGMSTYLMTNRSKTPPEKPAEEDAE